VKGQKENKSEKGEKDLKVAEKMEKKGVVDVCPLCGSTMEKGFLFELEPLHGIKRRADAWVEKKLFHLVGRVCSSRHIAAKNAS
jgi:hypothetical protein